MASDNVKLVRRVYHEFNSGQTAPLWAFADDVEWHTAADLPDSGTHRGRAGVSALVDDWTHSFDEFTADVDELIDRGEYVVAPILLRGRVVGSGDEVSLPETHVWKVRDGLVVEVREYRTTELALEALPARTETT